MRVALLIAFLALAAPAGGQELFLPPQQQQPETAKPPLPTVVRRPARRHPERASSESVKVVDIPQWAKDEGHNGTATYTATIDANGKLIGLELKESSMSPAIDAAVKARAERLWYLPATDKAGNAMQGTVDVRMEYARHNSAIPGGGIESYTCGDLTREYDWFTAANAGRRKLFWPQNAYTSLATIVRMEQGLPPDPARMRGDRDKREKMWAKLIKRCRKAPEKLMLSEVDQPEAYRRLVNSF